MLFSLLVMLAAGELDNPAQLEKAKREVGGLKLAQAESTLKALSTATGLSREQSLTYFALSARVAAMRGKGDEARSYFEAALELDPKFSLGERVSPKLQSPFFEARAAVNSRGAPGLSLTVRESGNRVSSLTISQTKVPARATTVRVWLDEDGTVREVSIPVTEGATNVAVSAKVLQAHVWVNDAKGWTLLEQQTQVEATVVAPALATDVYGTESDAAWAPPPPSLTPPAPAPVTEAVPRATPAPTPVVKQVEAPRPSRLRVPAWISFGLAAAGAVSTGIFYGIGASARHEFDLAVTERTQTLLPLTYTQAQQLDAQVRLGATGSTVSLVSTIGLLLLGGTLWLIGLIPEGAP